MQLLEPRLGVLQLQVWAVPPEPLVVSETQPVELLNSYKELTE